MILVRKGDTSGLDSSLPVTRITYSLMRYVY